MCVKRDIAKDAFFRIGVFERYVTERNGLVFLRKCFRVFRIMDRRFCLQHFEDTVGADGGSGNHDEDHRDDHERHQNMDRILQEGHHIADLHRAEINLFTADPDDEHGDEAHQECHGWHDGRHSAVDEDIYASDIAVDVIKPFFFGLLIVEGADNKQTGKLFAYDQVEPVHKLLNDAEFRECDIESDCHQRDDDEQYPAENAGHAGIAHDLEQRGKTHERGKQYDPQQHVDDHLDLLDIVGRAGDEGGRREAAEFLTGKRFDAAEHVCAHIAAGTGSGA